MSGPSTGGFAALFLRIGNLTFGGGDPALAAFQRELVDRRQWLSPELCSLAYSLARVTPGTNILAFCAAAGWQLLRWRGALLGVLAVSVPSAMLAVWLTWAYESWKSLALVNAVVGGTVAAAVGMMAAGALWLVRPFLGRGNRLRALVLVTASAALAGLLAIPPIPILAMAALTGLLWEDGEDA